VQVGPDPDAVCAVVDRATVVSDLAQIGGEGSIAIDLPLADLDDRQVADLADDCGAPLATFWPCNSDRQAPCGACAGCDRWRAALDRVGLSWPWEPVRA
jgi:7-cyano-7-deazaguanine synthase in queuosine biosynthesis